MFRRIVFLTTLLLFLGVTLCSADNWEQVDKNTWFDTDSIQTDANGHTKAVVREYRPDNMYYSISLLIDKSTGQYCYEKVELYNINGRHYGESQVDPKERNSWLAYSVDNRLISGIIERAGR